MGVSEDGYIRKSELCRSCFEKYRMGKYDEAMKARNELIDSTGSDLHQTSIFVMCGGCKKESPEAHEYMIENHLVD
ncbi:MAG: hypothetical protein JW754_02900 [Candidatus Aenigmarchaeota archaeon]|nr:hypothetical protein [Candidatus Aenigmarchaeota archaeon]